MNSRFPTIEWQVAGACNYDCSYCIQSKKYRKGKPSIEQINAALIFFTSLQGSWEIKCSGGEAFAHPLFIQAIVPRLMEQTTHRISVLTNFSASESDLVQFATLTRRRLLVFSASLHLEFIDVRVFIEKASWFISKLDTSVRFVVNQVVHPERLDDAEACKQLIEAAGLTWFPQLLKTKQGVANYADPIRLSRLLGDRPGPAQANLAPSYLGRNCWTGIDYATIDKNGDIWSCRTAKRHQTGRLGNIFEPNVAFFQSPRRCPWTICPCTVPANRGMIEGIAALDQLTVE